MSNRKIKIESRNDQFTSIIKSEITLEIPADENDFLVKEMHTHGYNVLDLMDSCDYIDVFFLLYNGDLPTVEQKLLLSKLSIFLINLGPRHTSARAAANAGIGRTDVNHIVPIAVMGMSGEYNGSKEVEQSMRYLTKHFTQSAEQAINDCLANEQEQSAQVEAERIIAPGFGTDHGGQSPLLNEVKNKLLTISPEQGYLQWANNFVNAMPQNTKCGWRLAGLVAPIFLDLNFEPRMGAGLFQMLSCPGAFAHGIQFSNKPLTDMPFLKDEDYDIINS